MNNLSILVLGYGQLGMAVLRSLAKHIAQLPDTTLTVLLRPVAITSQDPDKQQKLAELRSLNINFILADLAADSVTNLSVLFSSFHTVVSCIGFATGRGTQIKIARAVLDAGVKRYFPWQFGVDYDVIGRGSAQDLFDEQLDVRDLLRSQSRTEWIIISTGMFTSFLFEPSFGVVNLAQNTVHALGRWNTAITVTTPEDIGKLTAAILFATPRIANQVVYTAGDTVTYNHLANIVDSVLSRQVRRIEWSVPQLKDELAEDPDNSMKKYRVVFAEGKGVAWATEKTFNAQRGIETVEVEQWIREELKVTE